MFTSETKIMLTEECHLTEKEIKVLEYICESKERQNYFIGKISVKGNPKWIYPLDKLGFFNPENIPKIIYDEKSQGFSIPTWDILNYLEKVSENLHIQGNESHIKKILDIIKSISRSKDASGNHLENPRLWWQFIRILSNIPNIYIDNDVIDLIPFWLKSKYGTDLVGTEIITNLLPNFLKDISEKENIRKAEKVIKIISEIIEIPQAKEGMKNLGGSEKYKFLVESYWLNELFHKYYKVLGEFCSINFILDLSSKISKILTREYNLVLLSGENNINYILALSEQKDNYVLKIFSSKDKNPGLLLGYGLNNIKKEADLLKELHYLKSTWLDFGNNTLIDLQKTNFFYKVPSFIIKRKLISLYRNLYSEGTYRSFYEEEDIDFFEPLDVLTFALKNILLVKVKTSLNEIKKLLRDYFKSKHLYFIKMSLYLIGKNIDELGDLFWEIIDNDEVSIFFEEEIHFGDELKKLLENLKILTEVKEKKLYNIIENGPKYYLSEEEQEIFIKHWKQKRYQALSHHQFFRQLYEKYKKETGVDFALEPAIGKIDVSWTTDPSPLSKEEILKKSYCELIQFLLEFRPQGIYFDEPSPKGLAEEFTKAVEEQPHKYLQNIPLLLKVGYIYIDALLKGIEKANKNQKTINWSLVLDFIKNYIKRDCFWKNKLKIPNDYWDVDHEWVIGSICSLFLSIIKDKKYHFPEDLLIGIEEILFYIIDNFKLVEKKQDNDDYLIYSINSPLGKVLEVLILFYYRITTNRENLNEIQKRIFPDKFINKYGKLLQQASIEAYTIFGYHLYYLFCLDKDWVAEKIKIFSSIPEDLWEAFMSGYLNLYVHKVMESLYKVMKESGNYFRGINYSFKNKVNERTFIHHITIGFIHDLENLSNTSLFGILLTKAENERNYSQIDYVVMSLYSLKNSSLDMKIKNRIIKFWKYLYNKLKKKTNLNDSEKNVLSSLSNLTIYLNEINGDNSDMILLSATYLNNNYFNSSSLIESLDKLKDKGNVEIAGENIGKILLEIANSSIPVFQEKRISSIVKYLYSESNEKLKNVANKICIFYAQKGFLFLKDIYESYNK